VWVKFVKKVFIQNIEFCRGPENDVHTRAARLRLIFSLKTLAPFRSKVLVDFLHYVTQINCLTGAIISETYIRHISRMNIFNDYTILHRSPPRLHLHEGAGWTVGAASAGDTGPKPVCGGEDRRCGRAGHRRARVRTGHRQARRKCHWSAGEGLYPLRETSGPRGVSRLR
jgi:hypothetical protein